MAKHDRGTFREFDSNMIHGLETFKKALFWNYIRGSDLTAHIQDPYIKTLLPTTGPASAPAAAPVPGSHTVGDLAANLGIEKNASGKWDIKAPMTFGVRFPTQRLLNPALEFFVLFATQFGIVLVEPLFYRNGITWQEGLKASAFGLLAVILHMMF